MGVYDGVISGMLLVARIRVNLDPCLGVQSLGAASTRVLVSNSLEDFTVAPC